MVVGIDVGHDDLNLLVHEFQAVVLEEGGSTFVYGHDLGEFLGFRTHHEHGYGFILSLV
jgi:hypothetical protein